MDKYEELIEKAPIIEKDGKIVHISDFVNDIFIMSKYERFNTNQALEDIEVVIDFINQALENQKNTTKIT